MTKFSIDSGKQKSCSSSRSAVQEISVCFYTSVAHWGLDKHRCSGGRLALRQHNGTSVSFDTRSSVMLPPLWFHLASRDTAPINKKVPTSKRRFGEIRKTIGRHLFLFGFNWGRNLFGSNVTAGTPPTPHPPPYPPPGDTFPCYQQPLWMRSFGIKRSHWLDESMAAFGGD